MQQPLDALHHARIVLGDHLAHLDRRLAQLRRGHDLVQEPDALGFLGGDDAAGVEQLLGLRDADQGRQ